MNKKSLNIFVERINSPGILAAKLWIRDGSRADSTNLKGCHQILGSTLSRGCGPYNNHKIADIIEGYGASLRCDTYEDGLLISLKCIDSDAYTLLPILGWMIKSPHLLPDQINIEKTLTIKALQRQKESPFHMAFDGWRKTAYEFGEYSHDPLGSIKDLKLISQKDVSTLAESLLYRNKTLVLAGSCPENFEKKIMELHPLNTLAKQKQTISCLTKQSHKKDESKINRHKFYMNPMKTQQVILLLGKPTIPHGHPEALALRLLSCHLGSGMSSLLFKVLREKYGVVYEVGLHHPVRELRAPFIIHASTTEEKASTTLKLMKECWERSIEIPLTEKELTLAKAKFKGQLAHSLQSLSQKAERKAHLMGIGLDRDHDEKLLTITNIITSKELQRVANNHLKNPILSICGPNKRLKILANIWRD